MAEQALPPSGPRWYPEPRLVWLSVTDVKSGAFSDELMVSVHPDEELVWAVVPSDDFDEKSKHVKGLLVGESGDYMLVILRPASMGRTVLKIPKAKGAELLQREPVH